MGRQQYGIKASYQGASIPNVLQAYKRGLEIQEATETVVASAGQGQEKTTQGNAQGNVQEVKNGEEKKEREEEEPKGNEDDRGQLWNKQSHDGTKGEIQAVPARKMGKKQKKGNGQNKERDNQEGEPEEETEVIAVNIEGDGSNMQQEDEEEDAEMADADSVTEIVEEMEKLGMTVTILAPKMQKSEMRYPFLHNLRELRLETVECLGGEGDHLVDVYTRLQTKTKIIPLEVVENDELCSQAAVAIMANAETVMNNLRSEVEMKVRFTSRTTSKVLGPKVPRLLDRLTTPPRTLITAPIQCLSELAFRSSIYVKYPEESNKFDAT